MTPPPGGGRWEGEMRWSRSRNRGNSPVNWQVKHRMWQAIGSHLAASDRMAPQIPYPDAQLQVKKGTKRKANIT